VISKKTKKMKYMLLSGYLLDRCDKYFSKREKDIERFSEFYEKLGKGNRKAKRVENICRILIAENILKSGLDREPNIKEISKVTNLSKDIVRKSIDEKESEWLTRFMFFDIEKVSSQKIQIGRGENNDYRGKGTPGRPDYHIKVKKSKLQRILEDPSTQNFLEEIREEIVENREISQGITLLENFQEELDKKFISNDKDGMSSTFLDDFIIYKHTKILTNPIYIDLQMWILNIQQDIFSNLKKVFNIKKEKVDSYSELISDLSEKIKKLENVKSVCEDYDKGIPTWVLNRGHKEIKKFSEFNEEVDVMNRIELIGNQVEELIAEVVEEINKISAKWNGKFEKLIDEIDNLIGS
jgi:hypothetical protein